MTISNKQTYLIVYNVFLLILLFFPIPFLLTPIVILLAIIGNCAILAFFAFKEWKDSFSLNIDTEKTKQKAQNAIIATTEKVVQTGLDTATTLGPKILEVGVTWGITQGAPALGEVLLNALNDSPLNPSNW